jgi:C-terminal peptidase prc
LPPEQLRVAVFEQTWELVNEYYLYPDFKGIDWLATKQHFAAQVAAAPDDEAFYSSMRSMVSQLRDAHSFFRPPADADELRGKMAGELVRGDIGVAWRLVRGFPGLVAWRIVPGSPADRAGMRRGDVVLAVDGRLVDGANPRAAERRIPRAPGRGVSLTVQSPGLSARDLSIVAESVSVPLAVDGVLLAEGRVGYLDIPSLWDEQVPAQLSQILRRWSPAPDALIVDLRNNPGGLWEALEGSAELFMTGTVGYLRPIRPVVPELVMRVGPRPMYGQVRLAILVDSYTESFAEVLAGALRQPDRVLVLGQRTAGNTENVNFYDLLDGSMLSLSVRKFILADGTDLEGRGVRPDIELPADGWAYATQPDAWVERALVELSR